MKTLLAVVLGCALSAPLSAETDVVCSSSQTTCGGGASGASTSGNNSWTGTQTFIDSKFLITDDAAPTKVGAFQLSGITAGQTRTMTFPDSSGTLALLGLQQTWTTEQDFSTMTLAAGTFLGLSGSGGSTGANNIGTSTINTPDTGFLYTGSLGNSWVMAETADASFDFAHPQQTNPTLFIHSANQSTTQYVSLTHDATHATLKAGAGGFSFSANGGSMAGLSPVTFGINSLNDSGGGNVVSLILNTATTGSGATSAIHFAMAGTRKATMFFADDAAILGVRGFGLYNGNLADYQLVVQDNSRNVVIGDCVICAAPVGGAVIGPGGLGTNIAGGNIAVGGGPGSGSGTPGTLSLQTSTALGTGTTAQTLANRVVIDSHVRMVGTAPAVSACGASPSTVTGSDHAGKLTTGSGGTVQSCTLTFATAYGVAPACVANNETSILLLRATSTTTTLVIDSAVAGTLASQAISYICIQGS